MGLGLQVVLEANPAALSTKGSSANLGLLAAVTTTFKELKELNLSTCVGEDCVLSAAITEGQYSFDLFGFLKLFLLLL